ncbi:MAG: polyprenyl synthetase family protein [Verrucomicrobiota bacterium]
MNVTATKPISTSPLAEGCAAVERSMRQLISEFGAPDDSLSSAFSSHLESGGKRTRTEVSLSCSNSLGLSYSDATALASAVELLHNASLIQDDLQDRSLLRRGEAAIWNRFGEDVAIGLTDLAISASYRALAYLSKSTCIPGLLSSLHRAIAVTLRGQANDLDGTTGDLSSAISIARRKSGPLFALSLELPLIAAGEDDFIDLAREAAECLGVGYQICDDVVDLEQDRAGGTCGNIVLVLETFGESSDPLGEAKRLAYQFLEKAVASALLLPSGSGNALVELATAVRRRLDQSSHE